MCEVSYRRIPIYSYSQIKDVANIITSCGEDMYKKYNLSHWRNSLVKTILIVYYTCVLRHTTIWGVYRGTEMVATFQTRKQGQNLNFCKFAVLPKYSGQGIGAKCITIMNDIALQYSLHGLTCEVLGESEHALNFYLKRGFKIVGSVKTLKYTEFKLLKEI